VCTSNFDFLKLDKIAKNLKKMDNLFSYVVVETPSHLLRPPFHALRKQKLIEFYQIKSV
jgi:hypothetical protein